MKQPKKRNIGSVLVVTLIAISVGSAIVGSLMKYCSQDYSSIEKEIGHAKAAESLKLAMTLYNSTVEGQKLTSTQINLVKSLIGGGENDTPIFGKSSGGTPSRIPGFEEYSVLWETSTSSIGTTMKAPTDTKGFWYFEGTQTNTVKSTLSGDNVPAIRNNSQARYTSNNLIQVIPVFSMLSFYEKDWEISAHYESAQLIGHIHTNGSIFLDCRSSSDDRISFHGLQNFPILTANQYVYRRGRNGATSYYKFGSQANAGLDFNAYIEGFYNSLISLTDFNFTTQSSNRIFSGDMKPDTTVYEEGAVNTDTGLEPEYRRFGEGDVNTKHGYAFIGTFDAPQATTGTYTMVQWDSADKDKKLTLSDSINPYQYIEDIQYYNTPDPKSYAPKASNYQEDATMNNKIAAQAFNSIAPLVIRDGVAYYRTKPGEDLTPVMDLLTDDSSYYPSSTHPNKRRYADLRWYGWFGMYDTGNTGPTPSNPARWHFPVKSVTFNATKDANNAGTSPSSPEGTAVAFTFRNTTILNPVNNGVKDSSGNAIAPTWIRTDIDMTGLSGYPRSDNSSAATQAATDTATGKEIGMFNVDYPTIDNAATPYERYDPVRVGYNVVKAEVRKLYNACHIYTSAHNGTRMLNKNQTAPADGIAPDVWGSGTDKMQDAHGVDYNGDGVIDYSAFWNDDGAGTTPKWYVYRRNQSTTNTDATDGELYPGTATDTTPKIEFFPIRHKSLCNTGVPASISNWYIYKSTLPFCDRTLPMPATMINLTAPSGVGIPITGTAGSYNGGSDTFEKASDNDTSTFFDGPDGNSSYVEIDLGMDMPINKIRFWPRDSFSDRMAKGTFTGKKNTGTTYKLLHEIKGLPTPLPTQNAWTTISSSSFTNPGNYRYLRYTSPAGGYGNISEFQVSTDGGATWLYGGKGGDRKSNFGYPGTPTGKHNWMALQCNAPEMLARKSGTGVTFETPEAGFDYYAGDCGGYYGNDNLCMIDLQEKKILVFTEIDLAELTTECFKFNKLSAQWGFNFNNNTTSVNDTDSLQNIIYVVNTSMGNNFFGKRVHCGAVRLKRGAVMPFKLSIATPNALHIWGDLNCPGYWHHGKSSGSTSVSYWVPTSREHASATTIPIQSVGIYADSISAYENSWIPFDQSDGNTNSDDITKSTAVAIDTKNYYYGNLRNAITARNNENIAFDHKLWWEDDGMRREGDGTSTSGKGAQLFLNYHEMIFNHAKNDCYKLNSAWGDNNGATTNNRGSSNQIWKHIPIGINAALMYGNIESRLPSYFKNADVTGIPVTCPSSIDKLDWYMSWIPRASWQETKRDWMKNTESNTITNGGFDPNVQDNSSFFQPPSKLSLTDYFGTAFTGSSDEEKWENCKLKFGGGGMMFDIRYHTSQTENLLEWRDNRQDLGRNIMGAFTCIFESRQATHGWNTTMLGTESQQTFYSYDIRFNSSSKLPPGTPMTTVIGKGNYSIEGSKWEY